MFEKEAKEYADWFWGASPSAQRAIKQAYQQGAEYVYNNCNKQLTKAKEIIKDYMTIVKGAHTTVCGVSEENRTINVLKLNEEAEQFLKESEK